MKYIYVLSSLSVRRNISHGFYSFSPCFFYDFYAANGFEDFQCYIFELKPGWVNYFERCPYVEYRYGMPISTFLNKSKRIVVFFAARKAASYDLIQIPTQGTYNMEDKMGGAVAPFSVYISPLVSYYERWVPKFLKPLLYPHRHLLVRIWDLVFRMLRRFKKPVL